MGTKHYSPEYKQRIIDLAHSGRTVASLAREFEPCDQTIRSWLKQFEDAQNPPPGSLTLDEKAELRRLRAENKQLKLEREILEKAAAWFANKTSSSS